MSRCSQIADRRSRIADAQYTRRGITSHAPDCVGGDASYAAADFEQK